MWNKYFLNLCRINSEISLSLLKKGKDHPRLNRLTIKLYHVIFRTESFSVPPRREYKI
jgi:hypothetical protein